MLKYLLLFLIFLSPIFGEWKMFSDKDDTYLYNTQTGDVYIRYHNHQKNYEDIFVKMPSGVIPSNMNSQKSLKSSQKDSSQDKQKQLDAIKKAQDIMSKTLDGAM